MGTMNLPAHVPASPARLGPVLDSFFKAGGFRKTYLASYSGLPPGGVQPWGLTRVPFILINISGSTGVRYLGPDGRPRDIVLRSHEAMFFRSGAWMDCDNHTAQIYFRITLDTDHTLFGMQDRTESFPYPDRIRGSMELYPSPMLPDPFARNLVGFLEALDEGDPLLNRRLPSALTLLVLNLRAMLGGDPRLPSGGKAHATWMALRSYVDEHCFDAGLSRENVARSFRITPNHVSRLFATFGGTTYREYVEQKRMLHARMLLINSSLTIDETAHSCGYSGANYFVRVFRQCYGMPPGKYRAAVIRSNAPSRSSAVL